MAQVNYQITLPTGALLNAQSAVFAKVLPLVGQAVRAIAAQAQTDWMKALHGAKLWSVEKDAYAQSIQVRHTGDFSAVVESDYKYAGEIETGRPARDLKKMLDTSLKVRRTTSGKRFLVIPMRHNTPGSGALAPAMPASVYGLAKAMLPSRVTSTGQRESGEVVRLSPAYGMSKGRPNANFLSNPKTGQAATVAKLNTAWGGRLTAGALKAGGASAQDAKRYAGMVKMNTGTASAPSSAYSTFRIMMEGSKGWVVGAKPGLHLAQGVAQALEPKAAAALAEAVKRTVQA